MTIENKGATDGEEVQKDEVFRKSEIGEKVGCEEDGRKIKVHGDGIRKKKSAARQGESAGARDGEKPAHDTQARH
jgi:hypothetical protein